MLTRCLALVMVAVLLALCANSPLVAGDDKAHEATVVKVDKGKITLTFKGDDAKHTHDVAKDAKITLDDKKAKLEDLKAGFPVRVTMNAEFVITKIDARSKKK